MDKESAIKNYDLYLKKEKELLDKIGEIERKQWGAKMKGDWDHNKLRSEYKNACEELLKDNGQKERKNYYDFLWNDMKKINEEYNLPGTKGAFVVLCAYKIAGDKEKQNVHLSVEEFVYENCPWEREK